MTALCATMALALTTVTAPPRPRSLPPAITLAATVAAGVPLKVITIDLNDLDVRLSAEIPKYGAGHAEPFGQMVRRARPVAAITGTFFSNRTLRPVGDIVIDGRLAHFGGIGTALCLTDNNEVRWIRPEKNRRVEWGDYKLVLRAGPKLVTNGKVGVYPRAEGFRDPRLMSRAARLAVGVTRNGKLMFAATRNPVYLSRMARAMARLGAVDALNLDGGGSIGMHFRGRTVIAPRRWVTNLLVAYADREAYEQVKHRLLPTGMRAQNSSAQVPRTD